MSAKPSPPSSVQVTRPAPPTFLIVALVCGAVMTISASFGFWMISGPALVAFGIRKPPVPAEAPKSAPVRPRYSELDGSSSNQASQEVTGPRSVEKNDSGAPAPKSPSIGYSYDTRGNITQDAAGQGPPEEDTGAGYRFDPMGRLISGKSPKSPPEASNDAGESRIEYWRSLSGAGSPDLMNGFGKDRSNQALKARLEEEKEARQNERIDRIATDISRIEGTVNAIVKGLVSVLVAILTGGIGLVFFAIKKLAEYFQAKAAAAPAAIKKPKAAAKPAPKKKPTGGGGGVLPDGAAAAKAKLPEDIAGG